MISRAARLPRICQACRAGLTQRSAVLGFRALPRHDGFGPRRRFASNSDPPPQFNAETEALISEKLWGPKSKSPDVKEEENINDTAYVDKNDGDWDSVTYNEGDSSVSTEIDKFLDEVAEISSQRSQQENIFSKPRRDRNMPTETADERQPASFIKPQPKPRFVFSSNSDSDPVLDLPESDRPGSQPKVFRHALLHNEPLGVHALGVPADAIIINNPNMMRWGKKKPRETVEKPLIPTKDVDWERFSSMGDGDNIENRDHVWANINEFRPDTRSLRMRDFQKLCRALVNGFTISQLKDYFRNFKTDVEFDVTPLANYPWIERQAAWTPFNSLQVTPQVTEQMAYKNLFAQKLVVQKWKIGIQEHEDALGQAFVWVDPHYFKFVSHGSVSFLKGARNDFLDKANNEKLSTTSSECRLNITSRKAPTYAILERLDQHLKNVHHRTIPIGQITKEIPSAAELQDLAGITDTSLRLRNTGMDTELDVSWFDEKNKIARHVNDITTEDNADTVLRLLTTLPSRGQEETVECVPPFKSNGSAAGLFVGSNRERRSMAWRDKLRNWLRYVAPVGITSDAPEDPLNLPESTSLREYAGKLSNNVTTATFGHVLHSEAQQSTDKLSQKRRLLSPVTPHPASFSGLKTDYGGPVRQSTAIILKFAPYTDLSMSKRSRGPPIRLYIPITPKTNMTDFTIPEDAVLQCAIPWQVDDVMLPTQSVDVRLVNERHLPLDINQAPLKQFLKRSQFNLRAGRLQTPAQVILAIPEQWINPRSKGGKTSEVTVDVLYAFRGIEIHQNIEMPFQGNTLRYSLIEAGQHGGKRQELSLQAGPPGDLRKSFRGKQRDTFLQTVEDIVKGKFFSWSEGHKSVKVQQYDDFSYDLPEEKLGEDFVVTEFDPEAEKKALTLKRAEKAVRDHKLKKERAAAKVAARKKGAMFSLLLGKAKQPSETATKKPTGDSARTSADVPTEKTTEVPVEKTVEVPGEKTVEIPGEKTAEVPSQKTVEEPTAEPTGEPTETEPPKPKAPTTPVMDDNDFFRHFTARAGDQLDQFKKPPQRKRGKRGRAMKGEELDEDDPFKITPRPKRKALSRAESGSSSAGEAAGQVGSANGASCRPNEQSTPDDEWEDDDDEIEDNELTTAEIEAELVRMFGLDKKPSAEDASAQAAEEAWEDLDLDAAFEKAIAKPVSRRDAKTRQQTKATGSNGKSASLETGTRASPKKQSTNADDEPPVNKNDK
ncbi:mitochondrial inner-membrane-bound regulator-domain-containing protein [Dactylonectria estremocensis]|uniref:Mitochondrial inner-membrane-bound regulator-domain-containing protein n=1 Tax=Dactylonectria estremocensis TaxID=1079267 RepID=A0A9P9JEZ0_9HYPO|nr:mitochondrial inner-membrane-bound regulator-domain-containing protein [Dactylonectria estremocensis]